MSATPTMIPPQQLIDAAKAPELAYNAKDWAAARASITPDFVYDEVASNRKVQGADQVISAWQGWAAAFPDSRGTFRNAYTSGNTVILELTWEGTHQGPLQTPSGTIPPTGKRIEVRACMVVEVANGKAKLQRHYFDMATLMEQIGATA